MKIIVGLGNPSKEYENTRHNLGFWVVDNLAQKLNVELKKKKFHGLYYHGENFFLLKPQTYMNNSGECVTEFINYFKVSVADLLVVYDDINLPIGSFRYCSQNSGGGHNGAKNIIAKLETKHFKHLRVGIGYDQQFSLSN
jgi:PTH1 family peptidyl-tRNA hydrolase